MRNLLLLLTVIVVSSCQSIKINESTKYSELLRNNKHLITKKNLLHTKESIKKYHPNPFNSISEKDFDLLIDQISSDLPKDSIPETEFIYQYRRVYDTLSYGDPHFRIFPRLHSKKGVKLKDKNILVWPFKMLCIKDSLLIDESLSPLLQKGDLLLNINGKTAKELCAYTYKDRYMKAPAVQVQNHFCFSHTYQIKFKRDNKIQHVKVKGIPLSKYYFKEKYFPEKMYDEFQCGYFGITNFDNNKYMIKRLQKFIQKTQKKGYRNVIIDIRKNQGGNGDRFDELIALFSNRDRLPYLKSSYVKVSKASLDYGFPEDSIGKICHTPEAYFHATIPLPKKSYPGKMNYYILTSQLTGSMAATFANIMQYNKLGSLVGESLLHNALNYGEVIYANFQESVVSISCMQMNEYSKQKNGIIHPDIDIPYIAGEYAKGGDPILEKCLQMIQKTQ